MKSESAKEKIIRILSGKICFLSRANKATLDLLSLKEKEEVFVAILERAKSGDYIKIKPGEIQATALLCAHVPELKIKLLEFLESLPIENLSPDYAIGFGKCFNLSTLNHRFGNLLVKWKKQEKNKDLQQMAAAALDFAVAD